MDHLARDFDAMKLAERLQGINKEQLWVHLAAESPLEKYPGKFPDHGFRMQSVTNASV